MNTQLMAGFDNANFIFKSRSDFTMTYLDEIKKAVERIRSNRLSILQQRLKDLQESTDELEKHKNNCIDIQKKLKLATQKYDKAVSERR